MALVLHLLAAHGSRRRASPCLVTCRRAPDSAGRVGGRLKEHFHRRGRTVVLALWRWLQPLVLVQGPAVLSGASGVELEVARRTRCASRRYLAVRRLSYRPLAARKHKL